MRRMGLMFIQLRMGRRGEIYGQNGSRLGYQIGCTTNLAGNGRVAPPAARLR
jgi:hypothetical protein